MVLFKEKKTYVPFSPLCDGCHLSNSVLLGLVRVAGRVLRLAARGPRLARSVLGRRRRLRDPLLASSVGETTAGGDQARFDQGEDSANSRSEDGEGEGFTEQVRVNTHEG